METKSVPITEGGVEEATKKLVEKTGEAWEYHVCSKYPIPEEVVAPFITVPETGYDDLCAIPKDVTLTKSPEYYNWKLAKCPNCKNSIDLVKESLFFCKKCRRMIKKSDLK